MIRCPRCGYDNPDYAVYCIRCGIPLTQLPLPYTQQQFTSPQFYQQNYPPLPYKPNPKAAILIYRGLPPNCAPIIRIKGKRYFPRYYQGDYIFEFYENLTLNVKNKICQGITYVPDVTSVKLTKGKVVIVNHKAMIPLQPVGGQVPLQALPPNQLPLQTPSIALMKRSLTDWDPKIWVNRTLSVYRIEKVIGEGGNGYVLKGNYSGKSLAIKVLKLYGGTPEEYFKDLATEASNLVNLSNHDNIVKVYAVNVDSFVINEILKGKLEMYVTNPPMIVMELMEGGTLKDLLENDTFYYSSKWQRNVLRAIYKVALALDYIHSQGFVHMDVKPQNIFLSEKPQDPSRLDSVDFKLGDLGSAVRVNGKVKQITPEYSPPDVFQEVAKPYFDIFALGMTAYVLLTRKIDRPDLNEMNNAIDCYIRGDMDCVKTQVDNAKLKLMSWKVDIDPKLNHLIQSMISVDPSGRPTAREVADTIKKIDPTIN